MGTQGFHASGLGEGATPRDPRVDLYGITALTQLGTAVSRDSISCSPGCPTTCYVANDFKLLTLPPLAPQFLCPGVEVRVGTSTLTLSPTQ